MGLGLRIGLEVLGIFVLDLGLHFVENRVFDLGDGGEGCCGFREGGEWCGGGGGGEE